MKNRMVHISSMDLPNLRERLKLDKNCYYVEFDGRECCDLNKYLDTASKLLRFPRPTRNLDVYNDWMTDFTWLDQDNIVIIINYYSVFLSLDPNAKSLILNHFEKSVLPWWEGEVVNHVVDGKAKAFTVYLVD